MRLAFLGTPEAAVVSLRALVEARHEVVLVVTRPDRRRGRGAQRSASPVKRAANELGLRVGYELAELEGINAERGVVVAYGAVIAAPTLQRLPMLNVHFSLLPRWRGAAPVQRAILAGDDVTGVSIMSLEPELDTGPVHLERRLAIADQTADELTAELAELGARALIEVLATPALLEHPVAQLGEVTYAKKITKETLHLVPAMSCAELSRTVRLDHAFTFVGARRLGVLQAHVVSSREGAAGSLYRADDTVGLVARDGALALDVVQPEGGRPMSARDWWTGARIDVATVEWS